MRPIRKSMNYFRSFDLFGIKPSLYFKGRKKSGTNFGLCLTMLMLIFTSLCFGFFGQDLYYRLNPQLRYNEEYDPFPERITLDPEYNPILIETNSPAVDMFYTDPTLVNVKVSQFTMKQQVNAAPIVTIEDYQMEICRSDHFDKLDDTTKKYFLSMNLKDYFCIPKNIKNLTMLGSFDQIIFQTIKFTISYCSNSSTGNSCQTVDQIQNTMKRGFIGIYFVDYNINPGNYENPTSSQPKEVFTNFVGNSQKEIDIFFKNNYIETDDGVMLSNLKSDRISNFDSSTEMDFQTVDPDFILVYLKIKQRNAYYRRTYAKIQQLLAQIGGFINFFWIFAVSINYLHSHLIVITEIVMNVFRIRLLFDHQSFRSHKSMNSYKEGSPTSKHWAPSTTLKVVKPKGEGGSKDFTSEAVGSGFNSAIQKITDVKSNNFVESAKKGGGTPEKGEKTVQDYESLELTLLDYVYYYTGFFGSPDREKKKNDHQ